MALPSSGELSLDGINTHLRRASGAPFSLDDAQARGLAGKPWGAIAVSDFHGKWAGEKMVCGANGVYYGFSYSTSGTVSAAVYGSLTNRNLFGAVPLEMCWGGGSLYMKLAPGEARPNQTQLIIRDANFGAVATVTIDPASWVELGGLLYVAGVATNPFPSGATRWITWS